MIKTQPVADGGSLVNRVKNKLPRIAIRTLRAPYFYPDPKSTRAGVGDRVEISVPERALLKLSFLVYLLPIIAFIAGAIAGGKWGQATQVDATLVSIFGGGATMVAAFLVLKRFDRSLRAGSQLRPRMTRILFRGHSGQHVEEVKKQNAASSL